MLLNTFILSVPAVSDWLMATDFILYDVSMSQCTAKAHRKVKQMQIQMQAEKRQVEMQRTIHPLSASISFYVLIHELCGFALFRMDCSLHFVQHQLKESKALVKLERHEVVAKQDKSLIGELQKKLSALEADYNLRINRNGGFGMGGMSGNGSPIPMETQQLINRIQQLEGNNKSLIGHQEKSRRELGSLKETISSCNDTMRQQQQQILILNQQLSEMRKLHGFGRGNSSAEELLSKQIRVLKSQRRMLIQELKDLREQNEQFKNIIVTGGDPSGKK